MAIVEIPTRIDVAAYLYEIILDGQVYTLEFSFILRINRWIMNIYNADKEPLLMGIPLHSSSDLVGRFKDPNLPQGTFLCYDTEGKHKSADRDDLGIRVKLLYEEAS